MAERPDPDTDWLALADFLDAHANDMRAWTEDEPKFRATAEGLRQLAAITADDGRPLADHERSRWTAGEVRQMIQHAEELEAQLDAITAAIGDPDELGMYEAYAVADNGAGDELRSMLHRLAASLSPTPTPQHCPTCDSDDVEVCNTDGERHTPVDWDFCCPDVWHGSGQP